MLSAVKTGLDKSEEKERLFSAEDDVNTSVCSSRSRNSRVSDLGSLSGRFGRGTLGNFYAGGVEESKTTSCPFPEEWQYNTIPEVIENDDEID